MFYDLIQIYQGEKLSNEIGNNIIKYITINLQQKTLHFYFYLKTLIVGISISISITPNTCCALGETRVIGCDVASSPFLSCQV